VFIFQYIGSQSKHKRNENTICPPKSRLAQKLAVSKNSQFLSYHYETFGKIITS